MEFASSTWKQVRRAADSDGVAVVPMGSLEAHGPHLPCGTDTCQINEIVRRAADKAGDPGRIVVYPTVEYSITEWARPLAAASLSPATLLAKLVDIGKAAHELGFRKIVYAQGHANLPAVAMAMWQLRYERYYALYVDVTPYLMAADEVRELTGEEICHGGFIETSLMLAIRPELVDMAAAVDGPDDLWGDDFPFPSARGRPGVFCIPTIESLPDGLEGRARQGSAELGEQLLSIYSAALRELLDELLSKPVPAEYVREFRKPL